MYTKPLFWHLLPPSFSSFNFNFLIQLNLHNFLVWNFKCYLTQRLRLKANDDNDFHFFVLLMMTIKLCFGELWMWQHQNDLNDSLHVAFFSCLINVAKSHFQFILITIHEEISSLSLVTYSCRLLNYKSFSVILPSSLPDKSFFFIFFYNWIFIYAKFHVIVKWIKLFGVWLTLNARTHFFVLNILKVNLHAIKFYICASCAKK